MKPPWQIEWPIATASRDWGHKRAANVHGSTETAQPGWIHLIFHTDMIYFLLRACIIFYHFYNAIEHNGNAVVTSRSLGIRFIVLSSFYYRPQTRFREGNVFTNVCHSVHGAGELASQHASQVTWLGGLPNHLCCKIDVTMITLSKNCCQWFAKFIPNIAFHNTRCATVKNNLLTLLTETPKVIVRFFNCCLRNLYKAKTLNRIEL